MYIYIVTYRSIARQRLGKHIQVEAYALSNRTSIDRQRISKHAFSTIERLCGPCRRVTKGQKSSFELSRNGLSSGDGSLR
jgi:hypothetical protein